MVAGFFLFALPTAQAEAPSKKPVKLGNPAAPQGGTFRMRFAGEPFSLNPIISDGYQSVEIQFYVMEGLLLQNEHTYAWQPWLADQWSVSPDGKSYEFHLRENATWGDGKPVTAEDVKFSFDVIYDDRYPTAHMRPYYEGIEKVTILDRKRVRFTTKAKYYGNFISSAGLPVVPKHIYGDPKKGPQIHKTILGSGPYLFESWNEGRNIILKRNKKWWGWNDPLYAGKFKPERVIFQFVSDENVAFEMLKKGELDFMTLTPDQYMRAKSLESENSHFETERIRNLYPQSVSSIGFNLRREIFKDRQVRLALAHLADREMMKQKFFYGYAIEATGPWYAQSEFADPSIKPIPYDPAKALQILREAGWRDEDGDDVLEKKIGNETVDLRFTILTSSKQSERWLTVFKEDARQIGAEVDIKVLSGNAFGTVLDEGNFDAADLSSGGGLVEFNPKPGWHSSSRQKGGLNFTHFSDPVVDELIDRACETYDFQERKPMMREIYRRIAEEVPQIVLFNGADTFYAYSRRVKRPAATYNYDIGLKFWWVAEGNNR